jgi:hypothetical protein
MINVLLTVSISGSQATETLSLDTLPSNNKFMLSDNDHHPLNLRNYPTMDPTVFRKPKPKPYHKIIEAKEDSNPKGLDPKQPDSSGLRIDTPPAQSIQK